MKNGLSTTYCQIEIRLCSISKQDMARVSLVRIILVLISRLLLGLFSVCNASKCKLIVSKFLLFLDFNQKGIIRNVI